jgi:hypothetical protein
MHTVADRLAARIFDQKQIPEQENVILQIGGKTAGTLSNYCIYAGQAKAGKSTFISGLISSAFVPYDQFGQKLILPETRPKLALFDTESSTWDLYRTVKRIKDYADLKTLPDKFTVFSFREDQPKDILTMIETYLQKTPDCAVIVIDGLLDLCLNYNDEIETRLLTNWLKRITKIYNCFIVSVLHLSKNSGETLGHLGSNTDRWAQSTFIVKKIQETNQITLEAKFMRSDANPDPIAIEWNGSNFTQTDLKQVEYFKKPVGRPKKEK